MKVKITPNDSLLTQEVLRSTETASPPEARDLKYENAANILPPELLEEVRKHFPGGLLWIPKKGNPNHERDELIVKLVDGKVPVKEVAALAKMTPRHVYRIVRKRAPTQARPEN